uniref:Kelch like family member 17 n=2 Tax=Anser cygnoides TaxID=8845 RepID=A0A8B9E1B7_ANSCY|nr:kelch-like protein 17 isoform X2 [Anser cygnoides]
MSPAGKRWVSALPQSSEEPQRHLAQLVSLQGPSPPHCSGAGCCFPAKSWSCLGSLRRDPWESSGSRAVLDNALFLPPSATPRREIPPPAAMEGGVQLLNRDGHSISHNSKRHYHDAFVCMNRMRQRGLLCDIVLHVGTKEIKAHKVVLASCSPYFHAMFTNEMSESRQTHVTLHDIDPQALEQLVQYAYTAEIVVGEGNVQTLLPAASLLQLNGVRDACCKFLLSQLDPSNCLGIRGFADTHSCSDLLKSAHKYVLQHFVEVSKTEEFMLLPLKQVLDLISSDSLNVPSEEEVYRAVLSWVKHDVDSRRQHVPRLMKCVRLPLLSRDFLMSNVDTELLVRHHSECKDLLIEALKYHLMPEQRGVLSNSRTRPRRCEGASTVLFAVGGGSLFAIHGDCEAYDTRTDRWHMVASMSTRRARVGVAAIGNKLYAVGGYDGTSDLATVESYDPVTNSWQPEVSMGTRRSCLGVAALHGLLYAAGGYDGASCLNSAERYDPLTGTWTSIAAMSTRRRYVRVATLDQHLDAHCQHAEPPEQRRGGRAGGDALRGRRQRRDQLPELRGALQPQNQHVGERGAHEHPQEHPRPGGHGRLAVRRGWQRRELQPELHREVQPAHQQVGGSLLHVHPPEQRGGGGAGTAQLPTPFLAHPLGVFDEPLTKDQDLPYLKGTGAPGGAPGRRGPPRGAAGRYRRRAKAPGATSSPGTPRDPGAIPALGARTGPSRRSEMCFPGEHPPSGGRGEGVLSAPSTDSSHRPPEGCVFSFGEGNLETIAASRIQTIRPVPHGRAQPAVEAPQSPVGCQRRAALLPGPRPGVQALL